MDIYLCVRPSIIISCEYCDQPTLVHKREILRGNGRFCSLRCSARYHAKHRPKPEPNVKCAHCGETFYKTDSKLKKSKSGLYFCCREHKDLAQRIGGIKEIMPPHYGVGDHADYRKLALGHYGGSCGRCGFDKNLAGLVVHHKDRNRSNNKIPNLEVLCANCHAIEHWGKD